MANWVCITNGIIEEYHGTLPKNWKHVSGLNLLENDLEALRGLGWYPVTQETIEFPNDSEYYYIREEFEYQIRQNDVLEIRRIFKDSYSPPLEVIDPYWEFMTILRKERDKRLAASDFLQLADIQSRLTEVQKNQINTYRQALRDLPAECNNLGIFDINQVTWPQNVSISIN
jgi:Phage tail assembly chaperone protein